MHIPHLYFTSCSIRKLLTHTALMPHNVSVKQQDDNVSQHGIEGLLWESTAAVFGERLCIELVWRLMIDRPPQEACALTNRGVASTTTG